MRLKLGPLTYACSGENGGRVDCDDRTRNVVFPDGMARHCACDESDCDNYSLFFLSLLANLS